MSLKNTLFEAIDVIINTYIEKVSTEFGIDQSELHSIWDKNLSSTTPDQKATMKDVVIKPKTSDPCLLKLSKNELVDLCKEKGLKVTGTKSDLVDRLSASDLPSQSTATTVDPPKKEKEPSVLRQIASAIPTLPISKNEYGNFEHRETSLLLDEKTKKVIGKQNADGTIASLTKEDIDTCNRYKFQYEIPTNLNESRDKITVVAGKDDDDEDEGSACDDEFLEEEDEELSDEDYISDE